MWYAHVAHMAKHMNLVGGPHWWGARALGPTPKSGAGVLSQIEQNLI